jgi:hypothetical protein
MYVKEINNPIINQVFEAIKGVWNLVQTDKRFQGRYKYMHYAGSTEETINIIYDEFPILIDFRDKYHLTPGILFLSYNDPSKQLYQCEPHNHDKEGSIFFPVVHSEGAGTAFYDPPKDKIYDVNRVAPGGIEYTIQHCDWFEPDEVHVMERPHIMNTKILHGAYELITDHPDNNNRVACNWQSNITFNELDRLLHDT